MPNLTPEQRSLRASIGAHAALAKHGGRYMTEAARAANPSNDAYWLSKVDTNLPETERLERARHEKQRYFKTLAFKSSQARRRAS
jgi:hypothetical protein